MKNRRKYTKEILETAVRTSFTMREAMRKAGAPNLAGGTHHHISKLIRAYGIDTKHFLGQRSNLGGKFPNARRIAANVLVRHQDGRRQRAIALTQALLDIGREYRCYLCGLREWRKRKIVLEIEHKDADFQNDTENNLEFICPNCHSQTPTFCRGRNRIRTSENEKIRSQGRRTRHPSSDGYWRTKDRPNLRKVDRPTPGELQSMMQTMPMVKIGAKYGVSDNAVRKWVKRYGMEVVRRGLVAK
jgi:hypothetical protein